MEKVKEQSFIYLAVCLRSLQSVSLRVDIFSPPKFPRTYVDICLSRIRDPYHFPFHYISYQVELYSLFLHIWSLIELWVISGKMPYCIVLVTSMVYCLNELTSVRVIYKLQETKKMDNHTQKQKPKYKHSNQYRTSKENNCQILKDTLIKWNFVLSFRTFLFSVFI